MLGKGGRGVFRKIVVLGLLIFCLGLRAPWAGAQQQKTVEAEGKKRNVRVILDFVVNHTSDQHKWFQDSKSSKTSERRDWFIWRDGKGPGQPPNNWLSTFGLSAW